MWKPVWSPSDRRDHMSIKRTLVEPISQMRKSEAPGSDMVGTTALVLSPIPEHPIFLPTCVYSADFHPPNSKKGSEAVYCKTQGLLTQAQTWPRSCVTLDGIHKFSVPTVYRQRQA